MAKFPILTSDRLVLRQFNDADQYNVFLGLSDPLVIKYYGISFSTFEATKEQMTFFSDLEKDKTGRWWAVCCAIDGTFYGAGGFNNWSHPHRKAEIGFWLLPQYWRNGIMYEAMKMICRYGFDQMDLNRIEGFVESSNFNCIAALDKLGFTHEGTMNQCEIKDECFIDLEVHALFAKKPLAATKV